MTSDLTPNADPANIDTLRAKHPAPTHPDLDPTKLSCIVWPNPDELRSHWRSQEGTDYIRKWFSTDKIAQYLRTRSPVCAADIDGWKAREIIAPLFMGDDHEFRVEIRDELILPSLFGDFHPSHLNEYAGGLLLAL